MRRLAVPFALLLAAAGCGGDEGGGPSRTVTTDAGGAVTVTAREYSFDPNRVVVTGAGAVRIVLRPASSSQRRSLRSFCPPPREPSASRAPTSA